MQALMNMDHALARSLCPSSSAPRGEAPGAGQTSGTLTIHEGRLTFAADEGCSRHGNSGGVGRGGNSRDEIPFSARAALAGISGLRSRAAGTTALTLNGDAISSIHAPNDAASPA